MIKNLISILSIPFFLTSTKISAQESSLSDMISPVSHPVTFEDPRHSTEIRPIFVYHKIDDKFITQGGNAKVYALQARFKINDKLSFIATKDGYVSLQPKAVLDDEEGFADVAAGFKYSLHQCDTGILTAGLRYEIPIGKEELFQGQGDGAINPFLSFAKKLGSINLMAGSGLRAALDNSDSSFWDTDVHADIKLGNLYPLIEANLIHPYKSGDRLPIEDEGQDFFNFGAKGSAGENILTMGAGARYRLSDKVDFGAIYQFPIDRSNGARIIDWRVTTDMVIKF